MTIEWTPMTAFVNEDGCSQSYFETANGDEFLLLKDAEGTVKSFTYRYPGGLDGIHNLKDFAPVEWAIVTWSAKDELEDELGYPV